ncbi:hypothetical protein Clacol_010339 [Clathrus columnatus]|uniref:Peptide hydrolase n=1 Tax=Clathrus columnatus TaxID=1419009 RepID=A0AAV5AVZ1_9AGAM|nr:hypothetical protein Clacol_010339 [Clathrus columnatus]
MFLPLIALFALSSLGEASEHRRFHLAISKGPITGSSCADYLGHYGTENDRYHLYRTQRECLTSDLSNNSEAVVVVSFVSEERKLIYVQEAGIDSSIRDNAEESALLSSLEDIMTITTLRTQTTFTTPDNNPLDFNIIYRTNSSALLSVSSEMADRIDAHLPRFVVPVLIDTNPSTYIPVPPVSRRRILNWLDNLSFKSRVDEIVSTISVDYMRSKLEYLTGESSTSPLRTRYAMSDDAREAATWLKVQFEENGAECELHQFHPYYSPNVICRYAASGDSDGIIILGAHYDSRAGPMTPYIRAPGANDDGSGIASLLGITHAIKENNLTFTNNIQFAAFSGEEQGLVGSSHYAQRLKDENANVLLMVQADMIGYRRSDENRQIAFPAVYSTYEASGYLQNLTQLYSKELEFGTTYACCSDHESFYNRGFASTQVFERAGFIADPMYHNSGDLSRREGYDFEQIRSIAKVTFSLVLDTSLSS